MRKLLNHFFFLTFFLIPYENQTIGGGKRMSSFGGYKEIKLRRCAEAEGKEEGATPRTLPCIIGMSIHECQTGSKVKHNYDYDLKQ